MLDRALDLSQRAPEVVLVGRNVEKAREKLGEHLDYNQYVTIASRMDYLSPVHNDITWHLAVEKLFGIDREQTERGVKAVDTLEYVDFEIRRVVRLACSLARGRRKEPS